MLSPLPQDDSDQAALSSRLAWKRQLRLPPRPYARLICSPPPTTPAGGQASPRRTDSLSDPMPETVVPVALNQPPLPAASPAPPPLPPGAYTPPPAVVIPSPVAAAATHVKKSLPSLAASGAFKAADATAPLPLVASPIAALHPLTPLIDAPTTAFPTPPPAPILEPRRTSPLPGPLGALRDSLNNAPSYFGTESSAAFPSKGQAVIVPGLSAAIEPPAPSPMPAAAPTASPSITFADVSTTVARQTLGHELWYESWSIIAVLALTLMLTLGVASYFLYRFFFG